MNDSSRVLLLAALLLGGCSTESCPEGMGYAPVPGGGFSSTCSPLVGDAGGQDAGGRQDGGACASGCSGGTPVCDTSSGTCVQCNATDQSACTGATPLCDIASQTCVACMSDSDCNASGAAHCDASHTCTGCINDTGCTGMGSATLCNTSSSTCVECTSADTSRCMGNPCTKDGTCSAYGTDLSVCEACDTDANCKTGQLCVPWMFQGMNAGNYCGWMKSATTGIGAPNGSCDNSRPYHLETTVMSVDGTNATVCLLAVSTCAAFQDELNAVTCMTGASLTGPMADSSCGATGLDDGYCVPGTGSSNLCSVGCVTLADCPCASPGCTEQYKCTSDLVCDLTMQCPSTGCP